MPLKDTVCPRKNGQKLNISVTIQYRIIIVSLLGRALCHTRFSILMAVVHQKVIAQESLQCTLPHIIAATSAVQHFQLFKIFQ